MQPLDVNSCRLPVCRLLELMEAFTIPGRYEPPDLLDSGLVVVVGQFEPAIQSSQNRDLWVYEIKGFTSIWSYPS